MVLPVNLCGDPMSQQENRSFPEGKVGAVYQLYTAGRGKEARAALVAEVVAAPWSWAWSWA